MDNVGHLELSWGAGYNGGPIGFVSSDIICVPSGSTVTFIRDDGSCCSAYKSVGEGMGCVATHHSGLFAYSDHSLPPNIFVVGFPQFDLRCTCSGGAELSYRHLSFTYDGCRLVSLGGIPDFTLCVWDCTTGSQLCKTDCRAWPNVCKVSSNPSNWYQLVSTGPDCMVIWEVEKCSETYVLVSSEVGLPDETERVRMKARKSQPEVTIQDLPGEEPYYPFGLGDVLSEFGFYNDLETCHPVVISDHCWGDNNSVYCCCNGGQVMKVDVERMIVVLLVNPELSRRHHERDDDGDDNEQQGGKKEKEVEEEKDNPNEEQGDISENCIAVNRIGVFTGGKDGVIRRILLEPRGDSEALCCVGGQVSSLLFSPNFDKVYFGSSAGSLNWLQGSVEVERVPSTVFDHSRGKFVGVDILLSGDKYCVTCRENGLVQVWGLDAPSVIGFCDLNRSCISLSCSSSSHSCAVGTADGHVYFLDLYDIVKPRIVCRLCLHHSPVSHIRFDLSGSFLVTGSDDGNVFVCSALPSSKFKVIGYTRVSGPVQCLSLYTQRTDSSTKVGAVVVVNELSNSMTSCSKIVTFELTSECLTSGLQIEGFSDNAGRFTDEAIQWHSFDVNISPNSIVAAFSVDSSDIELFALTNQSKQLCKLKVPAVSQESTVVNVVSQHPSHLLPGGVLTLSQHGKWLLSCSSDGRIAARLTASLDRAVLIQAHNFTDGGVYTLCLTGDAQKVVTVGKDGSLACWNWSFSSQGSQKSGKAVEAFRKREMALLKRRADEDEMLKSMPTIDMTDKGSGKTWLDEMELMAHQAEDEKYMEIKEEIRQEIESLRKSVMSLIHNNADVPDIEKLERQDFNLDTEEQQLLTAESDEQVNKVREVIELSNIAKLYLKEKIKQECWDSMEVQGKVIMGFDTTIEVRNYPIRKRGDEEIKELAYATLERRIELAELEAQKEVCQVTPLVTPGIDEDEDEGLTEPKEKEESDGLSLYGSRGTQFGGENELVYSQFELVTVERRRKQIVLLKDCIHKIKLNFNKEFDELLQQKESEVARIHEKNIRIRKILTNLELGDKVFSPKLSANEHPEWDLEVSNDEVTVKKYISEEEKKRLDEEARLAEERRIAEMGDNARERALDMMMGGRLEVKTEDDIFKDLPKPEFMLLKSPESLNEEEMKQAREYEKKQAALLEEREKHRLALEAELKKLQSSITEACSAFDAKVMRLHRLRIHTETVVYEEELKILRMAWSLLIQEELSSMESVLQERLECNKNKKVQCASQLAEYKKNLENFKENYENLVLEDKAMDRSFKKDFSDCEPNVEVLYKLFKKRPRVQQLKQSTDAVAPESSDLNPFVVRLPQAQGGQKFMEALDLLDSISHMPAAEGIDSVVWQRLVTARRAKIQSEQQVKAVALELAEMNAFIQRRTSEDSEIQQKIESTFRELNKLREERTRTGINPDVQLLLKQGQVEVDPGNFIPDFRDSVLIHRSVIEDLNATIKTLGEAKIGAMNDSKDFRKNIASLEWEHQKLNMEMEDLREKSKEIQLLKVTKDLQMALIDEDRARNQQKEITTLEETLAITMEAHDRRRQDHKRRVAKLRRLIRQKAEDNKELDAEVEELTVNVAERHNVEEAQAQYPSDDTSEKRMRDIRARRRLVDLAKTQAQEVAVLRAEIERLRMRTFPALVKMDRL